MCPCCHGKSIGNNPKMHNRKLEYRQNKLVDICTGVGYCMSSSTPPYLLVQGGYCTLFVGNFDWRESFCTSCSLKHEKEVVFSRVSFIFERNSASGRSWSMVGMPPPYSALRLVPRCTIFKPEVVRLTFVHLQVRSEIRLGGIT